MNFFPTFFVTVINMKLKFILQPWCSSALSLCEPSALQTWVPWMSQELLIQLHRLDNRLIWISGETQDKVNLTPSLVHQKHQIIWHKEVSRWEFQPVFSQQLQLRLDQSLCSNVLINIEIGGSDHSWSFLRWFLVQNWSNWTSIRHFKQPVKTPLADAEMVR